MSSLPQPLRNGGRIEQRQTTLLDQLFVWSPSDRPDTVLLELGALAQAHFGGWRTLADYLNPDYPPRRVLAEGAGMLLRAPRSFTAVCAARLTEEGISVGEPSRSPAPQVTRTVLVLGRNFVVAESFDFETRSL